jgi:hypothetical protein
MPKAWFAGLLVAVVFAPPFGAAAQTAQAIEASETEFFVQTIGGEPDICGLEFRIVFKDRVHRQGATAAATGSLYWAASDTPIVAMGLIIYGRDFNPSVTPFSVQNGFVVVNGTVAKPFKAFPCQEKLGFCGLYTMEMGVDVLGALLEQRPLSIGFQRQQKSFDIVLPIAVSESLTSEKGRRFRSCMETIVKRAQANVR